MFLVHAQKKKDFHSQNFEKKMKMKKWLHLTTDIPSCMIPPETVGCRQRVKSTLKNGAASFLFFHLTPPSSPTWLKPQALYLKVLSVISRHPHQTPPSPSLVQNPSADSRTSFISSLPRQHNAGATMASSAASRYSLLLSNCGWFQAYRHCRQSEAFRIKLLLLLFCFSGEGEGR